MEKKFYQLQRDSEHKDRLNDPGGVDGEVCSKSALRAEQANKRAHDMYMAALRSAMSENDIKRE